MLSVLCLFLSTMFSVFRSGAAVQLENLAMQHQIGVLQRSPKKRPGVDRGGPCLLDVVVRSLDRLAIRAGHRQTRHGDRVAPERLFGCLGLGRSGTDESESPPSRKTVVRQDYWICVITRCAETALAPPANGVIVSAVELLAGLRTVSTEFVTVVVTREIPTI